MMSKQTAKQTTKRSAKVKVAAARTPDEHAIHEMVAREAYLLAEKRGFQGGDPLHDWLAAEKEINAKLKMDS